MFFVHPQIQLKNIGKAVFSLFEKFDLLKLEKKLYNYFPEKQVCFTDMGRSAFKIIVEQLNLQNSEILLPAYICNIFYPILKQYNITPIFLDIDPKTFHIKKDEIKNKITSNTKAILVCHTYGLAIDIKEIRDIVGYSVVIIEDCAHAFGLKHNNRFVGNSSDAALFSLYKQFPALRGGILVCPNQWSIKVSETHFSFRDLISFLNHFPFFAFFFKKFGAGIAPKMIRKEKTVKPAGINRVSLNLFTNFLSNFEKFLSNRREMALFFQDKLKELGFEVQNSENNIFCFMSVLIPKELEEKRDVFIEKLRRYKVFATRIWHTPIVLEKEIQDEYNIDLNEFPNTVDVAKRIINFPLQSYYTKKDIEKIINAIKKVLKKI